GGVRLPPRGRAGRGRLLRRKAPRGPPPHRRVPPRPAGDRGPGARRGLRAGGVRRRHRRGGAVTLTLDRVSHRYVGERGDVVHAVADTSVTIPDGQFVCV